MAEMRNDDPTEQQLCTNNVNLTPLNISNNSIANIETQLTTAASSFTSDSQSDDQLLLPEPKLTLPQLSAQAHPSQQQQSSATLQPTNAASLNSSTSVKNQILLEKILNEKKLALMKSPEVIKFLKENLPQSSKPTK